MRGDNTVLSGIFFDPAPRVPGTVANFSFEQDAAPVVGGVVPAVPTGWTAFNQRTAGDIGSQWAGGSSVENTTNTPLTAPADGNQYCYINMFTNGVAGGVYQDVGALQSNTTYTLTVAIGSRNDRTNSPGIISLLNGTNNTGTVLATGGGLPGTQNTWLSYTASYNYRSFCRRGFNHGTVRYRCRNNSGGF